MKCGRPSPCRERGWFLATIGCRQRRLVWCHDSTGLSLKSKPGPWEWDAPVDSSLDLSQWTTDRLGAAYVELLHQDSLTPVQVAERGLLQAEWTRRPVRERLAALRRQREAHTRVPVGTEAALEDLVQQVRG